MTTTKDRLAAELRLVASQCKPDRAALYEALATRAETGEFDAVALLQGKAYLVEEGLNHVFGLTLVEADLFKQQIGEFRLGQCHMSSDCI